MKTIKTKIVVISVIVSVVLGIGVLALLDNINQEVYGAAVPVTYLKKKVNSGDAWIYPTKNTFDFVVGGTTTASNDFWVDVSTGVTYMTKASISEDLSVSHLHATTAYIEGISDGDLDMNGYKIVNIGDTGTDFDDNGGLTLAYSLLAPRASLSEEFFAASGSMTDLYVSNNIAVGNEISTTGHIRIGAGSALKFGSGVFIDSGGTDDFRFRIGESTVALFIEGTTGYVGIGDTVPSYTLSVDGTASISGNTFIDGDLAFESNKEIYSSQDLTIENRGDAGDLFIKSDRHILFQNEADDSEYMRIADGGNVGIGDVAPTYKLAVDGTASVSDTLWATTVKINGGNWILNGSAITSAVAGGAELAQSGGSSTVPTVKPDASDDDTGFGFGGADIISIITGGNERIRIDNTGNVGIGDANPTYKLSVDGTASISGNFWATGAIDFGDATSFRLPIGVVLDTNAETTVDTTAQQFVYYAGGEDQVLTASRSFGLSLASASDDDTFLIYKALEPITITAIHCAVDPAGDVDDEVTIDVQECDSNGDNCVTVDAAITCKNVPATDDGSLTNGTIDANDWISLDIGTVSTSDEADWTTVTIYYKEDRQ